ncbi:MAG: hypothetical protein ILO36_08805 [Abditibacteriota bacterium]|nr:hypothetical protein [Abditibacteriota bacterium]
MKAFTRILLPALFAVLSAAQAFCAGEVLYEPYPRSTTLDSAHREPLFTVQSRVPALCAYSVNEELPFDKMTPFDDREPSNMHTARLKGLNTAPGFVNRVYIKCSASEETLEMVYCFLTEKDDSLSGAALTGADSPEELLKTAGEDRLRRVSLISSAGMSREDIERIKSVNPSLVCLLETSITSAPEGLPDRYYLRDSDGGLIEASPGLYRLDMTDFEAGNYISGRIYDELLKRSFVYDGCLLMDMAMEPGEIYTDYGGVRHSPAAEKGEEAWYKGIVYALRNLRWLYPWGIVSARTSAVPEDTTLFKLLNGKGIVYSSENMTPEGFRGLLDEYNGWMNRMLQNKVVLIETAAVDRLPARLILKMKEKENDPFMIDENFGPYRFGYALSRLYDGYHTSRINEYLSFASPWFDEYGFDLGKPVSKAKYYTREEDGRYEKANVVNALGSVFDNVFRRDFEKGIVLLNGGSAPATVALEEEYQRFSSPAAPLYERYYDNEDAFSFSGPVAKKALAEGAESGAPELYFGRSCAVCPEGSWAGCAIEVPFEGDYTLKGCFPSAGEGTSVVYCDLFVNGEQQDACETAAGENKSAVLFEKVLLKPGDKIELRISADGPFGLDYVYLASEKRYNDGSSVKEITLDPFDGILLKKTEK